MNIKLYTTLGCHLCDEALVMLQILQTQHKSLKPEEIEIADSEELVAKYGIRIPVVTSDISEGDIGWPFTVEELSRFLKLDFAGKKC